MSSLPRKPAGRWESIPDPLDWNRMFLFFRMTAGTPAAVKSGKTVSSILKRPRKRQNGSAAELYPLWCPCLAGRLPGSLIPRLRRLSKAIICRPATVLSERLGNLDGKLPQVPANRQKKWAAPIKPKRNPCLVNRPRLCGQYKKPLCRKY